MAPPNTRLANYIILGLILLAALILGTIHINSPQVSFTDELLFEEASFRMATTNQYRTQILNDQVWLEKPPLYFWLTAPIFELANVFNPTVLDLSQSMVEGVYQYPWIRRAITILAALITIIFTYAIASRLFRPATGIYAAALLLTSPQFLFTLLSASLDLTATSFISIAIYLYILTMQTKISIRKNALLTGITIGLAIMTRSLLAFTPLGVILIHQLLTPRNHRLPISYFIFLIISIATIILPWHLYQLITHTDQFLNIYLGFNLVDHAINLTPGYAPTTPLYYIKILFQNPWAYLLFIYAYVALTTRHILTPNHLFQPLTKQLSTRMDNRFFLLSIWILIPLLALSLSSTRHSWYFIQTIPPVAILAAALVDPIYQYFRTHANLRRLQYTTEIFFISCLLVAPAILYLFQDRNAPTINLLYLGKKLLPPDQPIYTLNHSFLPNTLLFHPHPSKQVSLDELTQIMAQAQVQYLFVGYADDTIILNQYPHLQTIHAYPSVGKLYQHPPENLRLTPREDNP